MYNDAERKAAAEEHQRLIKEQMSLEKTHIRLGAGQYGVSEHEKLFNASKIKAAIWEDDDTGERGDVHYSATRIETHLMINWMVCLWFRLLWIQCR